MNFVERAAVGYNPRVPVQNRILKIQKRNRALVRFDPQKICDAVLRAAKSIGGFQQDFLPSINETIFSSHGSDENIAAFLSDVAIVCLNSNPQHLISNFPPTIEMIQDEVLHALRSHGFQKTADAYECYRWGRHWMRNGYITKELFCDGTAHAAWTRLLDSMNPFVAEKLKMLFLNRWRFTKLHWTKRQEKLSRESAPETNYA